MLFFRGPAAASRAATAIAIGIVTGVLVLALYAVLHLRGSAVEAAEDRLDDLVLSLAEQASLAFSAADFVLDGVVQAVAAQHLPDSKALRARFGTHSEHELLRAREQSFEPLSMVAITDAEGDMVVHSQGFPTQKINLSDRESFAAAKAQPAGKTYVSAPVRNRVDGKLTFYLSRRLESPKGEFIGVAMVGLSCDYFVRFYATLRLDRSAPQKDVMATTLLRNDLTVLARSPDEENGLGRRLRRDGVYGRLAAGTHRPTDNVAEYRPWDAEPALERHILMSAQPVPGFPAQVAVAARETLYLAAWRRQALVIVGLALVASALLTTTFSALLRGQRRRERHLAEVQRLREAAEAASRTKSEFLATVSHEIRTPLNGILGTADLLVRSHLPRRERTLAETLLRSGRSLLGIMDDILDLSKIEAGELRVDSVAFSPADVLREMHDLFQGYAAEKGLELAVEVSESVAPTVIGDPNRVRQVLANLVSNAIKFSAGGRVSLRLAAAPDCGTLALLRYEVDDSGIGIPEDARDRIFQPFAQVDSSVSRRFGGTGLGLAICKRLVDLMGGRIDFRSTLGRGTCFWVELPVTLAHTTETASPVPEDASEFRFVHSGAMPLGLVEPLTEAAAGPVRRHVLVVEDNTVNALVLEAQLAKLGCSCDIAVNGEDAMICLRGTRYDLVLMDCMLPGMSGSEVTQQWREQERQRGLPRLPIIALTANALASNVEDTQRAGMDDFMTKPCTVDKLASMLRRWLAPRAATTPM
ncbi:ATP-binding protein [Aquabacterium sp. A7-Y]|uniref:hybrid sensor histidine kinase/response regulator n=1 Tax=Aquabacterium sp. A7-Y TaxID=1349605 RepID=UPI00223DC5F4|nr:hybrid sensor histidine kinase/response regulator [Aquabacterium sp. A7-Y]MCW7540647.1 ATP-binding protein [Aquabacterium sp. A7-Y]